MHHVGERTRLEVVRIGDPEVEVAEVTGIEFLSDAGHRGVDFLEVRVHVGVQRLQDEVGLRMGGRQEVQEADEVLKLAVLLERKRFQLAGLALPPATVFEANAARISSLPREVSVDLVQFHARHKVVSRILLQASALRCEQLRAFLEALIQAADEPMVRAEKLLD